MAEATAAEAAAGTEGIAAVKESYALDEAREKRLLDCSLGYTNEHGANVPCEEPRPWVSGRAAGIDYLYQHLRSDALRFWRRLQSMSFTLGHLSVSYFFGFS